MQQRTAWSRTRERRGGTAAYFALTLPIIGGIGAIGIEYAYLHTVRRELQGVADAAAHAAVIQLDDTSVGMAAAVADAQDVVAGMHVNGRAYALSENDLHFGYYDRDTHAFTESTDPLEVNAARVTPSEVGVGLGFGQAFFGRTFPVTVCAAVTQGPGNANTGETGGPGLLNGHFDVDTTAARHKCVGSTTCSSTTKHTHQYDDKFVTTFTDTFNVLDGHLPIKGCTKTTTGAVGSCTASGYSRVIPDTQPFKLVVVNADLSSGTWLTINGVDTDVTDYDDQTFASLPTYTLGSGATPLTELKINFNVDAIASCELIPTVTSQVRANTPGIYNEWRSGAITIQAVKPTATFTTGRSAGDQDVVINQNNGLLWETTFFWHWDGAAYTAATASSWEADYDALLCHIPRFIDSEVVGGGGGCG